VLVFSQIRVPSSEEFAFSGKKDDGENKTLADVLVRSGGSHMN
jgi:hypothetical protein